MGNANKIPAGSIGALTRIDALVPKQRRLDGSRQNCPRCGMPAIKPCLHTNAMSRSIGIYVCDACGNEEAMLGMAGAPLAVEAWAAARPGFALEAATGEGGRTG